MGTHGMGNRMTMVIHNGNRIGCAKPVRQRHPLIDGMDKGVAVVLHTDQQDLCSHIRQPIPGIARSARGTGIFLVGYALIWLIIYCIEKAKADKLNKLLKD